MNNQLRDYNGRFERHFSPWSPTNMNDGWINQGRFDVFLPSHHRADKYGYVPRAIVNYEYFTGEQVTMRFVVHHKDGNTLNDTKENLQKMTRKEHAELHNPLEFEKCVCRNCNKPFSISGWRLKDKKMRRGQFCSLKCSSENARLIRWKGVGF